MNQDIPKANKMRKFQIAVVVSLIVGFPLISILVNIKGAQNGKVFYSNIKNNLGQLKFTHFISFWYILIHWLNF